MHDKRLKVVLFFLISIAGFQDSAAQDEFRDYCYDEQSEICLSYSNGSVTAFSRDKSLRDGTQLQLNFDGSLVRVRKVDGRENTFLVIISRGYEQDLRPRSNKPLVINSDLCLLQIDPETFAVEKFLKIATHIWDAYSNKDSVFCLFQDGFPESPDLYSDDYFWAKFQTYGLSFDQARIFQEAKLLAESTNEYSLVTSSIAFAKSSNVPVLVNSVSDKDAEILGYLQREADFALTKLPLEYVRRKRTLADTRFRWDQWRRKFSVDVDFRTQWIASIAALKDETICNVWNLETGKNLMEHGIVPPANELNAWTDCQIFEDLGIVYSYGNNLLHFDVEAHTVRTINSDSIDESIENVKILGLNTLGANRKLRVLLVMPSDARIIDIDF